MQSTPKRVLFFVPVRQQSVKKVIFFLHISKKSSTFAPDLFKNSFMFKNY